MNVRETLESARDLVMRAPNCAHASDRIQMYGKGIVLAAKVLGHIPAEPELIHYARRLIYHCVARVNDLTAPLLHAQVKPVKDPEPVAESEQLDNEFEEAWENYEKGSPFLK